jgi:hypothetical protein
LFTSGLQPPLSIDVWNQNPQSLATAMSLARQFELQEQYTAPAVRPPSRPLLPTSAGHLALPAPLGAKAPTPWTITIEGDPIKRLTQAKQEGRRHLGLCNNCNEKFTRGHNRVRKQLFLLEGFEEEDRAATKTVEDVVLEDAHVFSLQALARVAFTDTMQLEVGLESASLVALLDSGSTHNLISEAADLRTGLPLQHQPRLMAVVTNGESVACVGVIRDGPLTIGGASFPTDLYVMPLAGYNVVLALGGSPCSTRSCGISATAWSPSHTKVVLSAGRGWRALVRWL